MSQNLFIDTHAELHELNTALEQLQEEYKFNIEYDDNTDADEGNEENILPVNDNLAQSIFTNTQIEEFHRIWNKDPPLHEEENEIPEDQQFNEKLLEQDIESFKKKLMTSPCCSKNCLTSNLVNYEIAIKKYQLFQNLNKNQQNMFLLGMLNANVRVTTGKKSLTSDYYFEGLKICMTAFLIIYGIGKRKWEAVRKHYGENDIAPIIHGLTGRKSNNAILFETVLKILTFVTNYANVHGLPSPGNLFFMHMLFYQILLINNNYFLNRSPFSRRNYSSYIFTSK